MKRTVVRWSAVATFLLILGSASRLAEVSSWVAEDRYYRCQINGDNHIEDGEALIHGVADSNVSRSMPAYSASNALLCGHVALSFSTLASIAVFWISAALVFTLGRLLYSSVCGGAAAFLYALILPSGLWSDRWLYTLAVLLVANLLVLRAQKPTAAADAWLGLGLGMSLLVMSPLCFFPFILLAFERARGRLRWPQACFLGLLPFLFLIPWIIMNWRLHHRFMPFEQYRGTQQLIMGVLGFVSDIPGEVDTRQWGGIPNGQSVFLWAAERILRHPLQFAEAFVGRVSYVFWLQPILSLAALAGAWRHRRQGDQRALTLLAAYYIGIHCCVNVAKKYFDPIWPILAVLASGLAAARPQTAAARATTGSRRLVCAVCALLLVFELYALGLAASYPGRAVQAGALDRELAKHPGDAWLWSKSGLRDLADGKTQDAAGGLGRALVLDPQSERQLQYLWALMADAGPVEERLFQRFRSSDIAGRTIRGRILAFLGHAQRGGQKEALVELASAQELTARFSAERGGYDLDAGLRERISNDDSVARVLVGILSAWPPERRGTLWKELNNLLETQPRLLKQAEALWWGPAKELAGSGRPRAALKELGFVEEIGLKPDAENFRFLAAVCARAGESGRALKYLERAAGLYPRDAGVSGDLAFLYQARQDYPKALRIWDRLIRSQAPQARLLSDRGVLKALMGRRDQAAEDLRAAIALDPKFLPPYLSLGGLYSTSGRSGQAAELYRRALSQNLPAEAAPLKKIIGVEYERLRSARP